MSEIDSKGWLRKLIVDGLDLPNYRILEKHDDPEGNDWYIIIAYCESLDSWLLGKCDTDEERCGSAPVKSGFPCYNVHGSLMSLITLRWS